MFMVVCFLKWSFCPFPGLESKSLPEILRRVAYPVEPFGFMFVQHELLAPLLGGIRNGLGKQAGLFEQSDDGQANELQYVHKRGQQFYLRSPQIMAAP
jgi:hypothetical protein